MALRADARRNQERLLAAARGLIAERGPQVPLDEVARAAGVGIGTLYRRFPDRDALLRAVVLDALEQARLVAEEASGLDDPFEALATYLRGALELRVSAVMPQVLDVLDLDDPELAKARDASAVERLVDAAREAGAIPSDVTFSDVAMMLVRISRPLPGPLPQQVKDDLARRHLELFIRGLRAPADGELDGELDGPAMSFAELRERVAAADE